MQLKRIIYGGLAASLVMVVGEFAIEPAMGSLTEHFFSRLGLPIPGESAMIGLVATILVVGFITVCLYAEFSVRSGAGVKTAAQTGALVWVLSCLLPNIVLLSYGVFDARFFLFATIWPLVQSVVATVIGAAVYERGREPARRLTTS